MGSKWNRRFAVKPDQSQQAIIAAIKAAGWMVWVIGQPCDLLCWHPPTDTWKPLEAKTPKGKRNPKAVIDKRQQAQIEFLALTGTPRVTTPQEAIDALAQCLTRQRD